MPGQETLLKFRSKAAKIADNRGQTLLHLAVERGYELAIEALLRKSGLPPMHYAAWSGNVALIELLFGKARRSLDVAECGKTAMSCRG